MCWVVFGLCLACVWLVFGSCVWFVILPTTAGAHDLDLCLVVFGGLVFGCGFGTVSSLACVRSHDVVAGLVWVMRSSPGGRNRHLVFHVALGSLITSLCVLMLTMLK